MQRDCSLQLAVASQGDCHSRSTVRAARSSAQSLLHRRHQCARLGRAFRRGTGDHLQRARRCGARLPFSQGSALLGFLRLPEEARKDRGVEPDYGLVSVGLSARRASAARSFGANRANSSELRNVGSNRSLTYSSVPSIASPPSWACSRWYFLSLPPPLRFCGPLLCSDATTFSPVFNGLTVFSTVFWERLKMVQQA
jgi:hypothetical protein